jgi:hypothetical protein
MSGIIELVSFVVLLAVTYAVYADAVKRNMNAVFWAVLTFLFPLVGVLLYLWKRK